MQTCYNCGREVDDNVLICPDCGALVKRYGAPVRRSEPEQGSVPAARSADDRTGQSRGRFIVRDENGKLRVRGFLKVLCIVCLAADLYLAFSQFFVLWLSGAGEFFRALMEDYAAVGMEASIMDMMRFTVDFVLENRLFVIFFGSAFVLKAACFAWFLAGKRRLALYLAGGVSVAVVVIFLFSGGGIAALEYCLDILVVMLLLLRSDWNLLPK